MSSTVGYLIVAIWKRAMNDTQEQPEQMRALRDGLGGESALMECIVEWSEKANEVVDERVDWDEYADTFDYECVDADGKAPRSLDAVVWHAIREDKDLEALVADWITNDMLTRPARG